MATSRKSPTPHQGGKKTQQDKAKTLEHVVRIQEDLALAEAVGDALGTVVSSDVPPLERLDGIRILSDVLDLLQAEAISDARSVDLSWQRIGSALGMTAPGVHSWAQSRELPIPWPKWAELGEAQRAARAAEKRAKWETIRARTEPK